MVNLPRPRFVFRLARQEPRGVSNDAEERIHTDRVVRTPDQTDVVSFDESSYVLETIRPACRAHDKVHPGGRDLFDIVHDCGGRREFDGYIRAPQALRVDRIVNIELRADFDPALHRERFNHPAHFSVTDDRNSHSNASLLDLLKHLWVQFGKELGVERFDGLAEVFLGDDDAEVQPGCALRDHLDIRGAKRIENARGHTCSVSDVLAHQTHNRLIGLHLDFRKLFQLPAYLLDLRDV